MARDTRLHAPLTGVVPMYQPPASRINLPVLLGVIALHAALFAYVLRTPLPRSERPARQTAAAPAPAVAPPAPAAASAPDDDADDDATEPATAGDDPRRALTPRQWRDNQTAAARQHDRRRFGVLADTADAPAQLPAAIERGLQRGDAAAATAAAELHDDCTAFGSAPPLAPDIDATVLQGLEASAQALVRADVEARVARLLARQQRCAAWREARERLAAARRSYAARADADRFERVRTQQQHEPPTPDLFERLRRELQALWDAQSQSRVGRALILQLLADEAPESHALGLRLLQRLAERDDTQVEFAANVLRQGYGRLPPQPALAAAWQRRAADLGADAAIDAELAAGQAAATAWAWHAWRLWLDAHGCYVDAARAGDALLVADLRALQQLDARLGPAERARAGQTYLERVRTFGARARSARGCDAAPARR